MTALYDWLVDPQASPSFGHDGQQLVYRYTDRTGLLTHLVPTSQLRMNSWALMNDPRETKSWQLVGTWKVAGSLTEAEVRQRVDHLVRRSARLLCASQDRPAPTGGAYLFRRGWAIAPMWHHYADGHQGACLVLDFSELNANLGDMPTIGSRRWFGKGVIQYEDAPGTVELNGEFSSISDVDAAVEEYLDTHGQITGLHLKKAADWAYENETRLMRVDFDVADDELDKPIDGLPLGDSLKAVILGDAHIDPSESGRLIRCQLGSHIEVMQCRWTSGIPTLVTI